MTPTRNHHSTEGSVDGGGCICQRFNALTAQRRTLAPCEPSSRAMALPMPRDEPVTTQTGGAAPAATLTSRLSLNKRRTEKMQSDFLTNWEMQLCKLEQYEGNKGC